MAVDLRSRLLRLNLVGFRAGPLSSGIERSGAAKVGSPPTITAPTSVTIAGGQPAAIAGVSVDDAGVPNNIYTVNITDINGSLLIQSGSSTGVSGQGSAHLTITGTAVAIDADLKNLAVVEAPHPGTAVDTITVNDTNVSTGPATPKTITVNVTCYASGTLIRTVRGDVAVESLAVGDLAVTASGAQRPVRWVGHRRTDCRSHPRPDAVMPVRIAANALGAERPRRDLFVSPAHAICVDLLGEVLIPAGSLVNGTTITQVEVDEVTYWHVELDSHDILLAENLPAESYLEMGNRSFFQESAITSLDANPDGVMTEGDDTSARTPADFCRPFHSEGPIVDVVRSQLRARNIAAGWVLETNDRLVGLHLVVDGERIDPVARGLVARFAVPAGARDMWLASTTSQPCEIGDSDDRRRLGVCVNGLTIDDGFTAPGEIDLADPLLCTGFYDFDGGSWRWTAGRAHLPAALWADRPDGFFLRVELAGPALARWVAPVEVSSAVADVTRLALVACAA